MPQSDTFGTQKVELFDLGRVKHLVDGDALQEFELLLLHRHR